MKFCNVVGLLHISRASTLDEVAAKGEEKVKLVAPGHVVCLIAIFCEGAQKVPLRSTVILGQTIMALILAAAAVAAASLPRGTLKSTQVPPSGKLPRV